MKKLIVLLRTLLSMLTLVLSVIQLRAGDLGASVRMRIDEKIAEIKTWAANPVVVAAVVAHNSSLSPAEATMTQERWKTLIAIDPFVRGYVKNEAAAVLKAQKKAWVAEAFVNDAKGYKVAFLSKTTNWCHARMPKHEVPMTGKVWQGQPAVDASAGVLEMQISVPVLKDGQPIGSFVVGLGLSDL